MSRCLFGLCRHGNTPVGEPGTWTDKHQWQPAGATVSDPKPQATVRGTRCNGPVPEGPK
jgi:hypothetical protein